MTKHFVPNPTGFQGFFQVLPRRSESVRHGLAPLEMILVMPVVVFLLVMIFYVAASSRQKYDLVSTCRNDAWEGRYQPNPKYRPQNLKPFVPAFPNGNISASVDNEPVKTGFYFDLWKQTANTKHLVLAKTWDHESEKLNRHPVFLNTNFISNFLKGFGMDVALEVGKNWLQDQLDNLVDETIQDVIVIKDASPALEDINLLNQIVSEILEDILDDIDGEDSIYEDAIDELDMDTGKLTRETDALVEDIGQEIENIQKRIEELEALKQSLIPVESDPELDDEILNIDKKINQLQLFLDDLKKMKQSVDSIQQRVDSILMRITELGDIEAEIQSMVNIAKAAVLSAKSKFETIISDLRRNPLDLLKLQSSIDQLISDARNSVKKMTNDIESLLKKVKKIKDDIEAILKEIGNLRTQLNELKKQAREL